MPQKAHFKLIGFSNYLKTFIYKKAEAFSVFLIILLLATTTEQSHAQEQYQIPLPKVIPPSPDAAALGKYGNTPVGMHTGIPNISIPLYTVKSGNLELPISISYHASGVKVNEIASWVGLGWSLNAGGVVARSVVGKSDEGGFWNMTVKTAAQLSSSDYIYMKGIADGGDGESDLYFFNFNNQSGKFIYKQNDYAVPFQIPQSPLNIKFISGRFEIQDEMGNKFIFGQPETSQLLDGSAETYNSAYYLTQIISANGIDNIQLTYVVDGGYYEGSVTDTETVGPRASQSGGGAVGIVNEHLISSTTSSRFILPLRLNEIIFATGKVIFIKANDRSDLPSGNSRLTEIQVRSKNDDGSYSTPIKSFTFTTGYFGSNINDYRLKLLEVSDKDAQSNTVRKHIFQYNETVALPARSSRAQDWWGFYNGQNSNTTLIPTEAISVAGFQYNVGGGSRQPSATHMVAGTLNKITYPTGGYTEFVYEPHYYIEEGTGLTKMAGGLRVMTIKDYTSASATPIIKEYRYGTNQLGYGKLLIPNYGLSSAKRDIDWVFNASSSEGACTVYAGYSGTRKVISSTAPLDLTSLNGAPVVYPEVVVYENTTSNTNGKQVSQFNVVVDQFTLADKAYNNGVLQLNNSWQGGDETWTGTYNIGGTKIAERFNSQSILSSLQANGTKIGYKIQMEGCTIQPGLPVSILFSHLYYFDYPTYSGIKKQTQSKNVYFSQVDPLKKIEQTEDYYYENLQSNHQQLTRKVTTDSDGDQVSTKYWYPADYVGSTAIGGTTIQTLLNANIIGKPIKTEKTRGTSVIEGDIQTYNQFGDLVEIYRLESANIPTHANNQIVPTGYVKRADIIYEATSKRVNKVQLTNNISTGYLWNYNNSFPVAKVENASPADVAATSFEFDGKGNWNYTGATYSDIAVKTGSKYYKLNGGNITKSISAGTYKLEYWAKSAVTVTGGTITPLRTSPQDANGWTLYEFKVTTASTITLTLIGTASIDELRLYPLNANMTTYTYDVINGITSINDLNNFVTYYDYDSFGRLKGIKDDQGNIVKAMDYHYRGN